MIGLACAALHAFLLFFLLLEVRAGCPLGFSCTSNSTVEVWTSNSSSLLVLDQASLQQPSGVFFEVELNAAVDLKRSVVVVDTLEVLDSTTRFLEATKAAVVSATVTGSFLEIAGRSLLDIQDLSLESSRVSIEFGSTVRVASLVVSNSSFAVSAPLLTRRLLLENVTYTLIASENASWTVLTPLAVAFVDSPSSTTSCEIISVARFSIDTTGLSVEFSVNRSLCTYSVPLLAVTDFLSIVSDECFDVGASCSLCAKLPKNCTYCPLSGVCAGRGVNITSACNGVTLAVCSTAPPTSLAVELIVGVVSAVLIVFWSVVVFSLYLFHRFRRKRNSASFDPSSSLPTENNSNDIMAEIMIVNNDEDSTEFPGTHSIEQLALAFVTTPNLPPLYETSSEGTVDGADSFGESSPDPAHYRRVDPATLHGLELWKIESGSGPLLIDENMNLFADVEVRDLLVIAARVTIFGTCTVFSGGKIELMPGAFLDVTGLFEDLTEPDATLRNRVPSATPPPAPPSSRTVVLTRQHSLSNTVTEKRGSGAATQLQSLSSLQSADSLSVANDATASALDSQAQASPYRRPSALVVIPSRSREERKVFGDSSSAREFSMTKMSMTSLSLPGLSEQRSDDGSRLSRESHAQTTAFDDANFLRILEEPASVAPPEILNLKDDHESVRNDAQAGSEEADEDGPRDKLSRPAPSPHLASKSSAHSISALGLSVSRNSSALALRSSKGRKASRLDSTPPSEEVTEEKPALALRRYRGPHDKDALDVLIHNVLDPHSISQSTSISTVTHDKTRKSSPAAHDPVLDSVRAPTNSQRPTPNNTVRVLPASPPLPPPSKEPPPAAKPRRPQTVIKDEITSSEEDAKSSLDEKEEFESETDTLEEIFAKVLGPDKDASGPYGSHRVNSTPDLQVPPVQDDDSESTPRTSSRESDHGSRSSESS